MTCRYCGEAIVGPDRLENYVDSRGKHMCLLPGGGKTLHHPTRADLGLPEYA